MRGRVRGRCTNKVGHKGMERGSRKNKVGHKGRHKGGRYKGRLDQSDGSKLTTKLGSVSIFVTCVTTIA